MMKLIVLAAFVAVACADVAHIVRPFQPLQPLKPLRTVTPRPLIARPIVPVIRAPVVAAPIIRVPVTHQPGQEIRILRQESDISPDGSYRWAMETENGISAQEQGVGGQQAQGDFSWTSPEGEGIQIQYVADENGYQPTGAAIPQPPPIPEAIVRSLAWIAAHPQPQEQLRRLV